MDFCGRSLPGWSSAATAGFNFNRDKILGLIERKLFDRITTPQRGQVMPSVQTIVALASLAAIASCLFAASWIGLALLGF